MIHVILLASLPQNIKKFLDYIASLLYIYFHFKPVQNGE